MYKRYQWFLFVLYILLPLTPTSVHQPLGQFLNPRTQKCPVTYQPIHPKPLVNKRGLLIPLLLIPSSSVPWYSEYLEFGIYLPMMVSLFNQSLSSLLISFNKNSDAYLGFGRFDVLLKKIHKNSKISNMKKTVI